MFILSSLTPRETSLMGAPSTLLTVVEISRNPAFGSTGAVRFETLELKDLAVDLFPN